MKSAPRHGAQSPAPAHAPGCRAGSPRAPPPGRPSRAVPRHGVSARDPRTDRLPPARVPRHQVRLDQPRQNLQVRLHIPPVHCTGIPRGLRPTCAWLSASRDMILDRQPGPSPPAPSPATPLQYCPVQPRRHQHQHPLRHDPASASASNTGGNSARSAQAASDPRRQSPPPASPAPLPAAAPTPSAAPAPPVPPATSAITDSAAIRSTPTTFALRQGHPETALPVPQLNLHRLPPPRPGSENCTSLRQPLTVCLRALPTVRSAMAERIEFTRNYSDLSTHEGFQFEFYCDRCGSGYRTPSRPILLGRVTNVLESAASRLFGASSGAPPTAQPAAATPPGSALMTRGLHWRPEHRSPVPTSAPAASWVCRETAGTTSAGYAGRMTPPTRRGDVRRPGSKVARSRKSGLTRR